MILCVYALIVPADSPIRITGVAGERLRVIAVGGVGAVAGELPRAPRPAPDQLRAYARTLEALAARVPALLPVRFGTCFDDGDELRLVLQSRQDGFRRSLRAVRGRAQMTLRIAGPGIGDLGSAESPARLAPDSRIADPASRVPDRRAGAAFLRARAHAAARAREVPGFDSVRSAVRRWVKDERVEKHGQLASVYHLVPRGSAAAYRRAVERAAATSALRLVVSGPYPPYAFSTTL